MIDERAFFWTKRENNSINKIFHSTFCGAWSRGVPEFMSNFLFISKFLENIYVNPGTPKREEHGLNFKESRTLLEFPEEKYLYLEFQNEINWFSNHQNSLLSWIHRRNNFESWLPHRTKKGQSWNPGRPLKTIFLPVSESLFLVICTKSCLKDHVGC